MGKKSQSPKAYALYDSICVMFLNDKIIELEIKLVVAMDVAGVDVGRRRVWL